MKKLLSVGLALLLLISSTGYVLTNPAPALGAVSGEARVVSTVGDGLRYYVVFEYNGQQYRSDAMGPAFNSRMWTMLNETDRKTIARNYAFAPAYRSEQFGTAGSAAITDWSNEVSGWKAAGEAWQKGIGAREYSELASYFTGSGYANLMVGDQSFDDAKAELKNFSAEIKKSSQYQSAYQLSQEIDQEYAAGQAIYNKLVEVKAAQVGNAFKAGSEVLLKDVIIDNIMVPAVTPSVSKVSELIGGCISFVKDRALDMYDMLQDEPTVSDILATMQAILNKLEDTDNGIRADINAKLSQLSSLMNTLRELEQQKNEENAQVIQQKINTMGDNADATFAWSNDATVYTIPAPTSEMDEAEKEARRAQVLNEADSIKAEFDTFLANILERKHDLYALLDYDDGGSLTNHPSFDQKYLDKLWPSSYMEVTYAGNVTDIIDMTTHIDPASWFSYYSPYSATKAAVASGGDEIIDNWDKSISTLENYTREVEAFIADESLPATLDSIEEKINGLEILYDIYIGDNSLEGYVFESNNYETIRHNLELMLTNQDLTGFYGPFGTDYQIMSLMQDIKGQIQKTIDDFQNDSPIFESDTATAGTAYDSLYTNLQNSATFMYGAYTSLKNLYKDNPYFLENGPIVNQDYINGQIAAAPEDQKETVINSIISDLKDLRAQEINLMHRINTGRNNCEYDAMQLDRLLHELGVYNNDTAYQNLGALIGREITDSWRYLAENDDLQRLYLGLHILNNSNIPPIIESLNGTSDAYFNEMLMADEIEANANHLRSLNNDDFTTEFDNYKTLLDNSMTAAYTLNSLQLQKAWAEYNRGYNTLLALQAERSPGSSEILVESITPVFAGTLISASSISLSSGETCQLAALINPGNSSNQELFWSSDNTGVVTVNHQGLVTAVADGNAQITVASADGNAEARCNVQVGTGNAGDYEIMVDCELPEAGAYITLSNPILQVSGSIEAEGKTITGFQVKIRSHAAMQEGDYNGITVEGIGPEVIGADKRFSFTVDLSTLGNEYLVPGTEYEQGYQLLINVTAEDDAYGMCLTSYYLVDDSAAEDLTAAQAAAALKVQSSYTAASWAILSSALALPETTPGEIAAKAKAINNALNGLILAGTGGGGGSNSSSNPPSSTITPPSAMAPPTTTGGTTTASTSITAAPGTANGTVSASLSESTMTILVNQAKTAETAGQKAVVQIQVDASTEARAVELEIPKAAFNSMANDTKANVTVNTPLASVTFNSQALQTINNAAPAGGVNITIANLDQASLSQETRNIVGDRPVYDFSVKAGNAEVSNFEGGKALISIPYTPKPGEKENAIVVYYIDSSQNLIAVRGTFNPAANQVVFEVNHFSRYMVGYNEVNFKDVKAEDWYSNAIGFLAARDIVKGMGEGSFGPDQNLTRGQCLVMIMRAYGIAPVNNATANFADAGNTYYTGYLAAARNLNIVSGVGSNMYAPERLITRQELFTMLCNTLQMINELPLGTSGRSLESFHDADKIPAWAQPAMKLLVETGTVNGSDNLLMPGALSSRSHMAQVLYNLLKG